MKPLRWAFALATLLFGVAVTLFFALAYPHHLHFQEQYQLFLFEQSYVCDVLAVPGGLADLAGRFVTQFFLYAWVGASIIAVVLICIQLLTYLLLRGTTGGPKPMAYALSFVPALLCCCFLCSEDALMSALMALLIVLGMALAVRSIGHGAISQAVVVISVPLVYMMAGAFVLPYALLLIIGELRHERTLRSISIALALVVLALSIPPFWYHLHMAHYPLMQLYTGPHYLRTTEQQPLWAWSAMCALPILLLLPSRFRQWAPRRATVAFVTVWALLMAVGGSMVNGQQSQKQEGIMAYDFMARNAMWNRIIQKAQQQAPRNQVSVVALNLALAERGGLVENMFKFPQNGIIGLLPGFSNDYVSPLVTSEALYRLGLINTAQCYVFEAQEAIPDFQKSARCYKRLAETNLINGDYAVARKYLNALCHTIYYRTWAEQTMALLGDEEAINAHPEYGALRQMRSNQDYFFGGNTLQQILGRQLESNPENRMAAQYLEAVYLLTKNRQ